MNAIRAGLPSISRTSRFAGSSVAVSLSLLIHAAVAATLFAFYTPPRPESAGTAIIVDLVSLAPETGTGAMGDGGGNDGGDDGNAEAAGATSRDSHAKQEPQETAAPEEPETGAVEGPLPPDPILETAAAETVPTEETYGLPTSPIAELPAPPAPAPRIEPPEQLAAIHPPPRPTVEVTPDTPTAPTEPLDVAEDREEAAVPSGGTAEPTEEPNENPASQVAALSEGESEDVSGKTQGTLGGGDPGGLFVGPGFRLGTARNPLPRYPMIARRKGWEGKVVLRVRVDTEGHPLSIRVAESSDREALDEAAVTALRRWRFEPARRAGQAIEAAVDVPITFRLRN